MQKILIICAILAVVFAAFFPVLKSDFVNWDDDKVLTENLAIRFLDILHIKELFQGTALNTYVPLTMLTYAIEYHFFGYDPFVYHLNNLLLHLAIVVLIFFFAQQVGLSLTAATLAAFLFGLHPMHVESVAWIAERKDVLYAFFYMLALIAYWRYLDKDNKGFYALSILFGILSMLSKAMALSLPLVFFALDYLHGRRFTRRSVVFDKIPHFLYVIPIAWITFSLNTHVMKGKDFWEGIAVAVWTVTFYIRKFFWPFNLCPLYEVPKPASLGQPDYLFALLVLAVCGILVFRFRRNRWIIFAALFYVLSIFFLMRFETEFTNAVADRFMYLPSLGICFLFGYLADVMIKVWAERGGLYKTIIYGCFAVLVFLLPIRSYIQCGIWKDSFTLWSYIIENGPDSGKAYNNRGMLYGERGEYKKAILDFNKAIEMVPNFAKAYYNRGKAYYITEHDLDLVLADYLKAVELNPTYLDAVNNIANIYSEKGEYKLALSYYEKAIKLDPRYDKPYFNRAELYKRRGELELALVDYAKALERNPERYEVYQVRAQIYTETGRYNLAIKEYSSLLDMYHEKRGYRQPVVNLPLVPTADLRRHEIYNARGLLYKKIGVYDRAIADYSEAIKINPAYVRAYGNRGVVYHQMQQYDRAISDFDEVIRLSPNYAVAYFTRSQIYFAKGDLEKALEDALKAQALGFAVPEDYLQLLK